MTRSVDVGNTTQEQEAQNVPFTQILDAIAQGVEARIARTVIANLVTVEATRIARRLRIPEEEIAEWRSSSVM